jgi:hypothetical protein
MFAQRVASAQAERWSVDREGSVLKAPPLNRLVYALISLTLFVAALATALTTSASADPKRVIVRLSDGSLEAVVLDLPKGATLDSIRDRVDGEPIDIEPIDGNAFPDVRTVPAPPRSTDDPPTTTTEPTPAPHAERGRPQRHHAARRRVPARPRKPAKHRAHKPRPKPAPRAPQRAARLPDGAPSPKAPGFMDTLPGPSQRAGVPNFVIRKFRVPPFLLSIYQAAGIQYGVRWEVLAAINEIETDYGRNLNVSSAGAVGWMQFMPSTWRTWGVDANDDHKRDPYNPVDAIFSAARYLKAAGYAKDPRRAILAYNHAGWYVDSVMLRARLIAGVPADLIGSLTGLTEGRFPVYAHARYAEDRRPATDVFARQGAPVVAVNDGVIKAIGSSPRLGRYVVLQDPYGNRYLYAGLGSVQRLYPVPREDAARAGAHARALRAHRDSAPTAPASAGRQPAPAASEDMRSASAPVKQRLFAHPQLPMARASGGLDQLLDAQTRRGRYETFRNYFSRPIGNDARGMRLRPLRRGSRVIGGTILGHLGGPTGGVASHLHFEIRPAGEGAPRIDPKPILDGWKLLEATAVYRPSGRNALRGGSASIGQLLLMPKTTLERQVLHDDRIDIYRCGREDIASGQIDRRVLATLEYLAGSGLDPTVSSLKCGHGHLTASGNVSEHASGSAVDISAINGIPILGHQDRGGITEQTVRQLMRLQGTVRPHQIISLLDLGANTLSLPDHYNHIHVGFRPLFGANRRLGREAFAVLKPGQWSDLLARLRDLRNPVVPTRPSRFALPVPRRGHGD